MTRSEWDALSPRERDAIVAEKVFGYTVKWLPNPEHAHHHGPSVPIEPQTCNAHYTFTGAWCAMYWVIPAYTTSWDAMREVVEKMRGMGTVLIGTALQEDQTKTWGVHFIHRGRALDYDGHVLAQSDSLPEAVALAALTALGHLEEG